MLLLHLGQFFSPRRKRLGVSTIRFTHSLFATLRITTTSLSLFILL